VRALVSRGVVPASEVLEVVDCEVTQDADDATVFAIRTLRSAGYGGDASLITHHLLPQLYEAQYVGVSWAHGGGEDFEIYDTDLVSPVPVTRRRQRSA
jgi:hypothetical protein